MTHPLRRAGSGVDASGATVTWSVAEGRRGRRWREVRTGSNGGVISSLLLETDPEGRFSHAELSTASGLLTLHPEPDGTLHGNTVTRLGISHIEGWPWATDGVVLLEDSPVAQAAALHLAEGHPSDARPVLRIGLDLACVASVETLPSAEPASDGHLPVLSDAATWPLERDED